MRDLTRRQKEVLTYIVEHLEAEGYPPTIQEIGRVFGFRSPRAASKHLEALQSKGYIRRRGGLARGIEVLFGSYGAIPLSGRIAAGKPIEAIEEPSEIDLSKMFNHKNCFILQVKGNSMVEDNIQDGDYVIVEKRSTAENGEIVVALVNGSEATLKRFYREKHRVRLEPANSNLSPMYFKDVKIQGVVLGVLRKYR